MGILSSDATCDKDFGRRVCLATEVVRILYKVWQSIDISREVKVRLNRTLVQSILL